MTARSWRWWSSGNGSRPGGWDGVAENYPAAMTASYRDACGHPTGNSGLSFIGPRRWPGM
ncbi:hypothetical protein [Actinoplanes sp. TFC3]|uniref:hypothetical protein n=1 Tax=Actinoplanes sp. TFC3 TaxID=1710355 RepID=UPI00191C31E5|nr:hypothetical protein [Actinoplanes sp. TFC3]